MTTTTTYTIQQALQTHLPKHHHYIVGVSGGSDSLALAYAMKQENYNFHAIIVDHQLQENSAQIATHTQTLLTNYNITSTIHKVDVHENGKGIEDVARKARYNALFNHGKNIVTGHTKNDQAETVLLGLTQGSGPTALTGMQITTPHEKGTIHRPMLKTITKHDTQTACDENNISYWNDPHNNSNDYTRVRVRNTILPTMSEGLNVDIVDKLATTSFMLQEERNFINKFVDQAYNNSVVNNTINIPELATNDPLIISHVTARFIKTHAGCVKKSWVDTAQKLIENYEGNKTIHIKGGQLRTTNRTLTWHPNN